MKVFHLILKALGIKLAPARAEISRERFARATLGSDRRAYLEWNGGGRTYE